MPKLGGLDFLKTLNHPPKTIITTAYKEHALEGFELNVADYILKPFSFDRLVKAVNKAIQTTPSQSPNVETSAISTNHQRFFLKGDKKHHQLNTEDILFIEAYGNYTKVYLKDEMIVSHEKISSFESLLQNTNFLRVHKSFIVSVAKIKLIEGNRILIQEHKIPIGQTYKSEVNRLYHS